MQLPAFLSLKWKLLLPLTLAMAIGTMALTWINDANLRREVQQARLDSATRNEALLRFLIQQNERQLVDAGSALADFIVAGRTGPLDLEAGFALQPYWDQLSLNQGFESLRLYDAGQQMLAGFGSAPAPDALIAARSPRCSRASIPPAACTAPGAACSTAWRRCCTRVIPPAWSWSRRICPAC